jgi:hypothetical protein
MSPYLQSTSRLIWKLYSAKNHLLGNFFENMEVISQIGSNMQRFAAVDVLRHSENCIDRSDQIEISTSTAFGT